MRLCMLATIVAVGFGLSNFGYAASPSAERDEKVRPVGFHGYGHHYGHRSHWSGDWGMSGCGCDDGCCGHADAGVGCGGCSSCGGCGVCGCNLLGGLFCHIKHGVHWLLCVRSCCSGCGSSCGTGCEASCGEGSCWGGDSGAIQGGGLELVSPPTTPTNPPDEQVNPFKDDAASVLRQRYGARYRGVPRRPVRRRSAPRMVKRPPVVVRSTYVKPIHRTPTVRRKSARHHSSVFPTSNVPRPSRRTSASLPRQYYQQNPVTGSYSRRSRQPENAELMTALKATIQ